MAILVFVSVVFTLYLAVDPDRTPRPKTSMLTFTREPSMHHRMPPPQRVLPPSQTQQQQEPETPSIHIPTGFSSF